MTPYAIHTQHLRKDYQDTTAVADLNLSIEAGVVFGFLGPNGAGKTTSIKMLLGLVHPTGGEGSLLGYPLGTPALREHVGFLPEHFRFHDWLKAEEFLQLHADLYDMPRDTSKKRIPMLLERVGLDHAAKRKLRTFSKGMLQRVGLAGALLNEPQIVFLDEPTSGLDPMGCRLVRDIISELSAQGTTVFLNSHLLSEVEITCHQVAFIREGRVIRTGDLQTLINGEYSVIIRTGPIDTSIHRQVEASLEPWARHIHIEEQRITLELEDERHLPHINRTMVSLGIDVYAITPRHVSLEDLFVNMMDTPTFEELAI